MDEDVLELLKKRRYAEAFEHMLNSYETKTFRMSLMFLKNSAQAEEVTQDIFLKLWRSLPTYDGRASPGTWLYAIARNTCLSAARSDAYRKTVPLDSFNEPAAHSALSKDVELEQFVDRLPEMQREVITLFYLQEKSVHEVARILDLPEGTVKSHLHRARYALAAIMKE
jgi:RNA polymerase sigma-70 factor (ECF subfamily)